SAATGPWLASRGRVDREVLPHHGEREQSVVRAGASACRHGHCSTSAAHADDGITGGGLTALSSKNAERVEQRLRRGEVGGVESLGEAPVDRGQQLPRLARLALSVPKPCETHRRPELPRQRSLAAGELPRTLDVIL